LCGPLQPYINFWLLEKEMFYSAASSPASSVFLLYRTAAQASFPYKQLVTVMHLLIIYAGLLTRSQYPEGPATLVSWFPCLKANAEMVPKTPSCYCMLLM
jgi:hypothetical protein